MRTAIVCCACLMMVLLLTSCAEDDEYGTIFVPTNNVISSQWAGAYAGTGRLSEPGSSTARSRTSTSGSWTSATSRSG